LNFEKGGEEKKKEKGSFPMLIDHFKEHMMFVFDIFNSFSVIIFWKALKMRSQFYNIYAPISFLF